MTFQFKCWLSATADVVAKTLKEAREKLEDAYIGLRHDPRGDVSFDGACLADKEESNHQPELTQITHDDGRVEEIENY